MFVMVVVRVSPNAGRAQNQKAIKLEDPRCQPRFSQDGSMVKIVVDDEQPYNNQPANAAAQNTNEQR
jgi:hypothetical protein